MKEFILPLGDFLRKGLRPDYRMEKNSPGLVQAQNVKINDYGIVGYDPVQLPISTDLLNSYGIDLAWPYPYLFRGMGRSILAYKSSLFWVNEEDWTLQPMDIYDYNNQSNSIVPLFGNLWQFVDFWDSWLLVNGRSVVFHLNKELALGSTEKVFNSNLLRITAGCSHRGRSLVGGFDPDYFWNTKLTALYEAATTQSPLGTGTGITNNIFSGLKDNFVMWSSIGGGDLLFFLDQASTNIETSGWISGANYGASKPFIYDYLRRNDWGFMPMPWQGAVRQIKELGDAAVVYGDGGVTALIPHSEPTPTYGRKHLLNVGVASTGAVGGDQFEHVFVDQSGVVWRIGADLQAQRLGYKEFTQDMVGTEIVISFDSNEREYYISNGFKTLILTRKGMSEATQIVTSAVWMRGGLVGFGTHEDDSSKSREAVIVTAPFDMKNQSIKTIRSVEVGIETSPELPAQTLEVAVDYRYKRTDSYTRTGFVPLNKEGQAFLSVSGVEFRLVIRYSDYELVSTPDYVNVRWQASDKRYIRGAYVTATNA